MHDLPRLVAATPVNQRVKLQILRDGKTRDLDITIEKLAEGDTGGQLSASNSDRDKFGLALEEIDNASAREYGLDTSKGILVTAVRPASPADEAGLQRGDIILEVNGRQTEDLQAFHAATEQTAKAEVLRLLIKRQDSQLYVALKIAG